MTDIVTVTTELLSDHWLVTADVTTGGTLPPGIFIYTNSGSEILGDFYGTCSLGELTRLQLFTGATIPLFGNKYVRYPQAKIKVALEDNTKTIIDALVVNVESLSKAYEAKATITQVYNII